MSRALALSAAPLFATAAFAACGGSGGTECVCQSAPIEIAIPTAAQGDVEDIAASGSSCAGVTPACEENGASGCARYRVVPAAAGDCHVDVDFASGTRFSADVTLIADSCCPGFYASPASAADIDVPAPMFDAGAG